MTKANVSFSALVAALVLWGAQSALAQPVQPAAGGEASTKTPAGEPNPTQRPSGAMPSNRDAVKSEARAANRDSGTTATPGGEASTMTNGKPNAAPAAGAMTRAEVSPAPRDLKPQTGKVGERPDVPTNPANSTGTPK